MFYLHLSSTFLSPAGPRADFRAAPRWCRSCGDCALIRKHIATWAGIVVVSVVVVVRLSPICPPFQVPIIQTIPNHSKTDQQCGLMFGWGLHFFCALVSWLNFRQFKWVECEEFLAGYASSYSKHSRFNLLYKNSPFICFCNYSQYDII